MDLYRFVKELYAKKRHAQKRVLLIANEQRGKFSSKETVVPRRWGVLQDNLALSVGLIMRIGTVKRFESGRFERQPFVGLRGKRERQGLTLETSAWESLYGGRYTLSTQSIKPSYYVHYTWWHLRQCVDEHKTASSSTLKHFSLKHFLCPQGSLYKNFTILRKCRNMFDCLIYEMIFFINELRAGFNVQSDSIRAKVF